MRERRRSHRMTYNAVINIDQVYNQDETIIGNKEFPIEIIDISKGGIGFNTQEQLPLNYYFNAKIDLGSGKQFYSVLRIMRMQDIEEGYSYGCEFVGLADILSLYIDEYEQEN